MKKTPYDLNTYEKNVMQDKAKTKIETKRKRLNCPTLQSNRHESQVSGKFADVVWKDVYSGTEEDDKYRRWMRLGRINDMTVAILTKAKFTDGCGDEVVKYAVKVPNATWQEVLIDCLIADTEKQAKKKAEKHLKMYASKFSR